MDMVTTHLGLKFNHVELNWVMAPLIGIHGELVAYAIKGLAVAALLVVLMLLQYRKPRVWQAYLIASWISAVGVVMNLTQLLSAGYSTASM
jgi:O-antigen/teichoic acid export membrane protein